VLQKRHGPLAPLKPNSGQSAGRHGKHIFNSSKDPVVKSELNETSREIRGDKSSTGAYPASSKPCSLAPYSVSKVAEHKQDQARMKTSQMRGRKLFGCEEILGFANEEAGGSIREYHDLRVVRGTQDQTVALWLWGEDLSQG
jgi:hypothetical protein